MATANRASVRRGCDLPKAQIMPMPPADRLAASGGKDVSRFGRLQRCPLCAQAPSEAKP
jgi:hypothetical protein